MQVLARDAASPIAQEFARRLLASLEAVVSVAIDSAAGQVRCTGWMVTPSIAAVPAYALRGPGEPANLAKRVGVWNESRWRDAAHGADDIEFLTPPPNNAFTQDMGVALLRLTDLHPVARLDFDPHQPAVEDLLLMLHHAADTKQARMSFGQLQSWGTDVLGYDIDSGGGSGGAPLFDRDWRLVGMHFLSHAGANSPVSFGLPRAALVAMLQRSRWWKEIASHQRLADVVAVRASEATSKRTPAPLTAPVLVDAALRFTVDPKLLADADRKVLAEHVVTPAAKTWTLKPAVRQAVLRAAGSLGELAPRLPPDDGTPEHAVVARILRGPPYDVSESSEEELSRWLQAVRWFAGIAPGLPSPARVHQLLQRRRVRGRLTAIAGDDFLGRNEQLRRMREWFQQATGAPLNVWGVGGIGKSALVAQFLAELPESVVILWLDFDRADLAPDDAASIVSALLEQAAPQLAGDEAMDFADPQEDLDAARKDLEGLLARSMAGRQAVVVLDSFEAAQYSERYQELWPELERLAAKVPALQAIVSGRAPVRTLRLRGQPALEMELRGLAAKDASTWLGRHGVPDARIQDEVVRASGGMPLVLKLAERLVRAGGKLADLPMHLPKEMIAGVLYDRILDRVQNPVFQDLAKGAVVLRRLTPEMMKPVFDGVVKLPPGEPSVWYRELSREAALVEGTEELRLRPEVRAAALALLERQDPGFVEAVERRAIQWYSSQDTNDAVIAAERVYHALRLGDLARADAAWREGCALHLAYAEETLHGAARDWLLQRLGTASVQASAVPVWEAEAADRVQTARRRDKDYQAKEIFAERQERSRGGALAFQEAYELRGDGRFAQALELLQSVGFEGDDRVSRERAVLAALLCVDTQDRARARRLLFEWREPQRWRDRRDGSTELAALHAARVCLATDLQQEKELARALAKEGPRRLPSSATEWLTPMDFLLHASLRRARRQQPDASLFTLQVPDDRPYFQRREYFLSGLDHFRQLLLRRPEPDALHALRKRVQGNQPPAQLRSLPGVVDAQIQLLADSWERWAVLADGVLTKALRSAMETRALTPLAESAVTVLSLFVGIPGLQLQMPDDRRSLPLDDALRAMESRLSFRAAVQVLSEHPLDFLIALRKRALGWCRDKPKPLELLVERFARGFEEE